MFLFFQTALRLPLANEPLKELPLLESGVTGRLLDAVELVSDAAMDPTEVFLSADGMGFEVLTVDGVVRVRRRGRGFMPVAYCTISGGVEGLGAGSKVKCGGEWGGCGGTHEHTELKLDQAVMAYSGRSLEIKGLLYAMQNLRRASRRVPPRILSRRIRTERDRTRSRCDEMRVRLTKGDVLGRVGACLGMSSGMALVRETRGRDNLARTVGIGSVPTQRRLRAVHGGAEADRGG